MNLNCKKNYVKILACLPAKGNKLIHNSYSKPQLTLHLIHYIIVIQLVNVLKHLPM